MLAPSVDASFPRLPATPSAPEPSAAEENPMATNQCEVCGNQYDKAFQVVVQGKSHTFDSFECAIHALAPRCSHCKCRIVGHGMEKGGRTFCCAHCASQLGVHEMQDRA